MINVMNSYVTFVYFFILFNQSQTDFTLTELIKNLYIYVLLWFFLNIEYYKKVWKYARSNILFYLFFFGKKKLRFDEIIRLNRLVLF